MIIFIYIGTFIISFFLTFLVKEIAKKKQLVDIPNERSSHVTPTPRGGGLAIVVAWFVGISILHFSNISIFSFNEKLNSDLYYALMTGILVSGISFLDDIYTLKSLPRIIVQSIAVFLALYFIGGLKSLDLGFTTIVNPLLLNVLSFFGILWFINLFNFIDGINGYLSTGTIIIAIGLFFYLNNSLLLILVIAVLGFLPWNWGKAKIFMGDIGSTLLGFTIAVLFIYYENTSQFSLIDSLTLSSVFWFDATFTLAKRAINKEKITKPHKKHAYQRAVQSGFSHQTTTLIALLINLSLFGLVYVGKLFEINSLIILGIALVLLYIIYQLVGKRKSFE